MANNKLHGYNPDPSKEVDGNRLDVFNPHEFRTGMDYELTLAGCFRLSESTEEDRRTATETVLGNLKEHGGYYTALITYETQFRNEIKGAKKPAFKAWLAEQGESNMKEISKKGGEFKNDKMSELKEAIKKEIKNIMSENLNLTGKEAEKVNKADNVDDKYREKSATKNAKTKAVELAKLDKEEQKAKDKKKTLQDTFKPAMVKYNEDGDKAAYEAKVGDIPAQIKTLNKELKAFEKKREDITLKEKEDKQDVAKMAMDKDTHMALLQIIKEAGINLREGADGVKLYYEIAKSAYMEGLTAGMKN
jgi:hypothetical protein